VEGHEERCGLVCIRLFDMSKGEGRASEARGNSTTFRYTGVEMG